VEHLHSRVPYFSHSETPHLLGRGIAAHATDTDRERFAGQCLGSWDLMRVYNLVDADGTRPDCPAISNRPDRIATSPHFGIGQAWERGPASQPGDLLVGQHLTVFWNPPRRAATDATDQAQTLSSAGPSDGRCVSTKTCPCQWPP
jgi:hypothetical protein